MANQITVTWAGDTTSLTKSNQEVARSATQSGAAVGEAWDKNIEKADTLDTRAMGFRDTLTGLQDGALGVKQAAAGDWGFETLLLLGFGIGDLASGFVNLILPALKATKIATLAQAAATKASAAATKVWTGIQWLFNASMLANPIVLIIAGIVALIAVIVLIATKTDWFQRAWRASWGWIKNAASNTWNWLKQVPGWIGQAFSKVADFVTRPFRTAFNFVARAWNNTIGGLSFTIPGWVPGIGGKGFSVPRLSTFHSGGIVPGIRGTAVPIMALAGERVGGLASSGGGATIMFTSDDSAFGKAVLHVVREAVIRDGGTLRSIGVSAA